MGANEFGMTPSVWQPLWVPEPNTGNDQLVSPTSTGQSSGTQVSGGGSGNFGMGWQDLEGAFSVLGGTISDQTWTTIGSIVVPLGTATLMFQGFGTHTQTLGNIYWRILSGATIIAPQVQLNIPAGGSNNTRYWLLWIATLSTMSDNSWFPGIQHVRVGRGAADNGFNVQVSTGQLYIEAVAPTYQQYTDAAFLPAGSLPPPPTWSPTQQTLSFQAYKVGGKFTVDSIKMYRS
jgi:hypothetical protein